MERFHIPFPARINRLGELATDVWWSWQPGARALFRRLDLGVWRATAHNPARMLRTLGTDVLQRAADDPEFVRLYDAALAGLDAARQPGAVLKYFAYFGGPLVLDTVLAVMNGTPFPK